MVNCVVSDLLPLSFCEGEGVKALMEYCEPSYQPPSGPTIKAHLMKEFNLRKEEFINKMKQLNVPPVLTCDSWTNMQMSGFFSIMIHFIDDDWVMHSYNLSTTVVDGRHTAKNLAKIIDSEMEKIGQTAFCVTHDTAANMNAALQRSQKTKYDIGCLAHLLSLAVHDSIKDTECCQKLICKIRQVIGKITKSENFMREFRKIRNQLLPNSKQELQLNVETRWNSDYIMLFSFKSLFFAYITTMRSVQISSVKDFENELFQFSNDDEALINDILLVLSDLKEAADIWEGQHYVTISVVYPVLFAIMKKFSRLDLKTTNGKTLMKALITNLNFRFSLEDNEFLSTLSVHMISTTLDIRFKDLNFLSGAVKNNLHDTIKHALNSFKQEHELNLADQSIEVVQPKKSKLSLLLDSNTDSDNIEMSSDNEFYQYISEKQQNAETDPLAWWKVNAHRYPVLSNFARRYLQIPATSASSERLFSTFGNIYSQKRMSLNSETAEAILFLNKNKNF